MVERHEHPGPVNDSVVTLRLFAAAREAAGTTAITLPPATVGELLDAASARFGLGFAAVVVTSRFWLDGEPVERSHPTRAGQELAVLPPVTGG